MLSQSTPSSPFNNEGRFAAEAQATSRQRDGSSYLLKPDQRTLRHMRNIHCFNLNLAVTGSHRKPVPQFKRKLSKEAQLIKAKSFTDMSSALQQVRLTDRDYQSRNDMETSDYTDEGITTNKSRARVRDAFQRQIDLQKTSEARLVNSFFSLHEHETDTPIYVSEVKYKQMNPYFTEFDLSRLKCHYQKKIKMKLWCQKIVESDNSNWTLLINLDLALSALHFIGENLHQNFKEDNIIILELKDGFYMVPTQFNFSYVERNRPGLANHGRYSSSFDQLMRLNNLQQCLRDSERNKAYLSQKIGEGLEQNEKDRFQNSIQALYVKLAALKEETELSKMTLLKQKRQIDDLKNYIQKLQLKLSDIKQEKLNINETYGTTLNDYKSIEEALKSEKMRLVNVLRHIFPIEPLSTNSNEYTILKQHIPLHINPSIVSKTKALEISFVLNMVGQIVSLLSYYLCIPLRFSIEVFGSNSYIHDQISQMSITMFPLWLNNLHNLEKFEYGFLLLNKNVEQLLESIGMRVIDNRNILGNLNMLLICISDDDLYSQNGQSDNSLIKKQIQRVKHKKSKLLLRQKQAKNNDSNRVYLD